MTLYTQYCVCFVVFARYSEAVQPVEDGLALVERDLVPTDCCWPATDTVIQDVSSALALKVSRHQRLSLTQ